MKFDVGQRVVTPKGDAVVTAQCRTYGGVTTSRGMFPESMVSPWVDVATLKSDPEAMERWLDEPVDDTPPREIVATIDEHCTCGCGRCHRILHKAGDRIVFRSGHMTISTDCRCLQRECSCLS